METSACPMAGFVTEITIVETTQMSQAAQNPLYRPAVVGSSSASMGNAFVTTSVATHGMTVETIQTSMDVLLLAQIFSFSAEIPNAFLAPGSVMDITIAKTSQTSLLAVAQPLILLPALTHSFGAATAGAFLLPGVVTGAMNSDENFCSIFSTDGLSTVFSTRGLATVTPTKVGPDGTGSCTSSEFRCSDGACISDSLRCDKYNDCKDGSDEIFCSSSTCSTSEFKCSNGECIPSTFKCNGNNDCGDKSDENNCGLSKFVIIGIAAAASVVSLVVIVLIVYKCARKRRRQNVASPKAASQKTGLSNPLHATNTASSSQIAGQKREAASQQRASSEVRSHSTHIYETLPAMLNPSYTAGDISNQSTSEYQCLPLAENPQYK
eukprot:m.191069 g.191069  ORF g.191069 m.191069 type:complete len:380 (+) comp39440_c0_seq2:213-1352(+)